MKKAIVPILTILVILVVVTQTHLGHVLRSGNIDEIAGYIKSFGFLSIGISAVITILQTFFPFIPYFLVAGVNVVIFGPVFGFVLTWLSAVTGACLSFLLSRYVAHDWAQAKVGHLPFFQKLNKHAERDGFRIVLMARLIPVIPSGVINMAAGLSKVSFTGFLLATLLGKAPITFFEAILGHDLLNFSEHKLRFLLVMGVLGLLMWGGSKLGGRDQGEVEPDRDAGEGQP
ncbi:TVP38/TMEM64 family protein [Brevibacillus dissolubilis]|uniref:TVP38/TMEM64 family protein n=1 Tax=Brevibacillus dissolubilis TaxID=1844116 RepID=UPI001116FD2E|nr:TVP38/TMEM64 family protein [Brevibacillus dissolubilis]